MAFEPGNDLGPELSATQGAPAASIDELTRDVGLLFRDRSYAYCEKPRYWKSVG
jgi:hypothetical protein